MIATEVSVTLPVFLTRNDHWILSPRSVLPLPLTSVTAADFVRVAAGLRTRVVEVDELLEVTVALVGLLPVAVAVLVTTAASPSACVIVYAAAVQVVEAPGARVVAGQEMAPALGSVTATVVTVTLPVLVTLKVQVILSPASLTPSALESTTDATVFCRARAGLAGMVVVTDEVAVTTSRRPLPVAVAVLGTEPASVSAWVMV